MGDGTQSSINVFAPHQRVLRERLRDILAVLHPILYADVAEALEGPGKLFSVSQTENNLPSGVWSLLTLLVAQHIAPDIDMFYASSVAVAVECFICALDLLDDIEDGDQTLIVRKLGPARVLNISTTLLALAQRAILSALQTESTGMQTIRLLTILQEVTLEATAGQHRDILAEWRPAHELTQEECIEIVTGKAGSLMCLACQLGALCANADEETYALFTELGKHLGIAHQLDNDCHDLYHLLHNAVVAGNSTERGIESVKTDLIRSKKTLPVVLATEKRCALYKNQVENNEDEQEIYQRTLREGILASWGICLLYRERASDNLLKIKDQRPLSPALRLLLNLT